IEEQEPSVTSTSSFTANTWTIRNVNTFVHNNGALASVSSGQVTLPAGTYYAKWSAPSFAGSFHKTRFQNITDGATVGVGSSEYCPPNTAGLSTASYGSTVFTITASKALAVQHIVSAPTGGGLDGGRACSFGVVEVYSRLELYQLS
ncbi:MAG: hypothetical protein ACRD3S_02160, partial [Terracidiphilus sp.]